MKIIGTGSALPEQIVTNEDLTKFLDTSDEWIVSHTGIRERRVLDRESVNDIGTLAARRALEDAGLALEELDLLICSNVASDYFTPGPACFIAGALGFSGQTLDINGACTGFLQALDIADAYLRAGKARNVLIVAAEKPSYLADWTDRATCVLFGDGAGAVVLQNSEPSGCIATCIATQPNEDFLNMPTPAGNCPFTHREGAGGYLRMNGQEVYRFAVSSCVRDLRAVCEKANVSLEEVDWFLLHQANQRILNAAQTRLKQPKEKFPGNIERLGNTSSACIPLLLDEMRRDGRLREGQLVALSAFGAGLTHGAALLRI
ncbi:MAG TPA: ketoacyl-ACP synthase III [Candidatus Spyradocola merdavium]|nr:ketoacyl-ACP synthase III [Candidatus Spyradocola merdavium]